MAFRSDEATRLTEDEEDNVADLILMKTVSRKAMMNNPMDLVRMMLEEVKQPLPKQNTTDFKIYFATQDSTRER